MPQPGLKTEALAAQRERIRAERAAARDAEAEALGELVTLGAEDVGEPPVLR